MRPARVAIPAYPSQLYFPVDDFKRPCHYGDSDTSRTLRYKHATLATTFRLSYFRLGNKSSLREHLFEWQYRCPQQFGVNLRISLSSISHGKKTAA